MVIIHLEVGAATLTPAVCIVKKLVMLSCIRISSILTPLVARYFSKSNMVDDKDNVPTHDTNEAPERGKKAIDAGKIANGEQPSDPKVKEAEKKDAEAWRNEG